MDEQIHCVVAIKIIEMINIDALKQDFHMLPANYQKQ